MPRPPRSTSPTPRIPRYRRQKRKGRADRAFVEHEGTRRYFPGELNSPESLEAYHRFVAELLAGGHTKCSGTIENVSRDTKMSRSVAH